MSLAGKRFAFVLPRYFAEVIGGAETLSGNLAVYASRLGAEVEIWTTCAKDNRTWENHFEPGKELVRGIPVSRFLVDERNLEEWIPRQIQLSQGMQLSLDDQFVWMKESVNSASLYKHIEEHGKGFDLLFFAPYLFGSTFWGSLIYPDRSVLIPCLHDEANAYLEIVGSMFRQVKGCLFNARPEEALARSLYGEDLLGGDVGMGFEFEQFEQKAEPYFGDSETPYLLYLGRMETGKNAHVMLDYFVEGKESGVIAEELKLVIAGGGSFSDLERPDYENREDVLSLGRVSEEEKRGLLENTVALVQPSVNESFCIVMMEGWLQGVPSLVHENCDVTKDHVVRSGGGLYFRDALDFAGSVKHLLEDESLRKQMGRVGRDYVHAQYSWDAVMDRFESVVNDLMEDDTTLSLAKAR